jgi:hypothetical protein
LANPAKALERGLGNNLLLPRVQRHESVDWTTNLELSMQICHDGGPSKCKQRKVKSPSKLLSFCTTYLHTLSRRRTKSEDIFCTYGREPQEGDRNCGRDSSDAAFEYGRRSFWWATGQPENRRHHRRCRSVFRADHAEDRCCASIARRPDPVAN